MEDVHRTREIRGRRCGRRENPRLKRGRRIINIEERETLFPYIPKTSSTFHSVILTSSTHVFHTSSNVFHETHGNHTQKFKRPKCTTLPSRPQEVTCSSPKPSEPSEARRARLQNITLSQGMPTYMKPGSGVCEKNTHVQRKPCALQTPLPFSHCDLGDRGTASP